MMPESVCEFDPDLMPEGLKRALDERRQARTIEPGGNSAGDDNLRDALDPVLVRSQKEAVARLSAVANTYFQRKIWESIPIRPRFQPLIVGPSGVGKSYVAELMARSLHAGFLRLNYGEWIPLGAREGNERAFERIHKHVIQAERSVIFVDELDKFQDQQKEWTAAVTQELFMLLDRSPPKASRFSRWDAAATEALRYRTFVVGAGTWQGCWQSKVPIGFVGHRTSDTDPDVISRIEASGLIPDELLRRFDADFVVIPPYSSRDVMEILLRLNERLAPELRIDVTNDLVEEVARSGRNMRAIQLLVFRALQRHVPALEFMGA